VRVLAFDGERPLGSLMMYETRRSRTFDVAQIEVLDAYQRRGVATALYEQAAQYAWRTRRYALVSDWRLNEISRSFWEKQVRLGHAQCAVVWTSDNDEDVPAGVCKMYRLRTPPPDSLR